MGSIFLESCMSLLGSDKSLAELRAVAYASPETRVSLIDGIKNQDAINKQIKTDELLNTRSKRVDIAVTGAMGNFKTATLGSANDSSRLETVNALQKMVQIQAKRDLIQNPDGDPKAIAQKAYDDVVGATYAITNGGKSSVIVPRAINGRPMDTKIVGTYLDVYSKADNFSDLNVAVPKGVEKDKFLGVLESNHRWVTNDSQTGVKLMQIQRDGNLQPVYNTLGKPVEKSYDEINMYPGKKVIEANKSFMTKLFGG
jgi:hypothetical protein